MKNWVTLLINALIQRRYTQILTLPFSYVCTHVLAAHSLLGWIVDLGAAKHVARDRVGFIDCRRALVGKHYVVVGNGSREDVLGVGTYLLKLCLGHTLLHDVLYVPSVHYNVIYLQ